MTIFEIIEDFLNPVLTLSNGGFLISVISIVIVAVMLGLLNISRYIILTSVIGLFLMFTVFGWIPLWIIILLALILFALIYTNIQGGSNV